LKFVDPRSYADPEAAARKLMEIANAVRAGRLRARAVEMPPGHERDIVLRKLREMEMACGLSGWINSRGGFSRRRSGPLTEEQVTDKNSVF
jgi:hypothetical protein